MYRCHFRALGSYVLEELGLRSISRDSAAARRWCAVRPCEPVGRDRYCVRDARADENIQFCEVGFGYLLIIAGPVQWPAIRVRAEYSRRRLSTLDPGTSCKGERMWILRELSTLGGDRVLSIPITWSRFGISESRVRSAEIEYSRSRYLGESSEYPRAEYARRRSSILDSDISEMVRNIQEPSMLGDLRRLEAYLKRNELDSLSFESYL